MNDLELVDRQKHAALKLSAPLGDGRHFVPIVPEEVIDASVRAPVFLTKDSSTGRFYVGAMLGFKVGENLLLEDSGRMVGFVPMDMIRQGFFISGDFIAINPHDPRFASNVGDPLFDENGEPSDRLRQIQHVLGRVKSGVEESERFIAALMSKNLVEAVDISLRFDDGETISLQGLYTISLDAMEDLSDGDLLELFRQGNLQLAYAIAHSLRQIPVLAESRNRKLGVLPKGS